MKQKIFFLEVTKMDQISYEGSIFAYFIYGNQENYMQNFMNLLRCKDFRQLEYMVAFLFFDYVLRTKLRSKLTTSDNLC